MAFNPNWYQNPFSSKPPKSGKTLTQKIRDLGFIFLPKPVTTWARLQQIQIKLEENLTTAYTVALPSLNMGQIIYYQPKISYDENNPGKNFYKIAELQNEDLDSRSSGSPQINRISDIEVISYKPIKKMKFRKKKRQSSIITRIEEILNKHKGPLPSRDPSEESVTLPKEVQREKDINDLPERIFQKIFLHFTMQERNLVLSRVCRNWYYILKDPMFWTELEFAGNNIEKDVIIGLITRHLSLRKLRFTAVPNVADILQELCRCNHNITHLGVRHCNLSNQEFTRIILHVIACCTNLEMLDIKGMRFQSESFYLEVGRLKNFKSINLSGNKLLRAQDLITLSVNCRKLQELKIMDISPDQGSPPLRDEDVAFVISHLQPNLRTLKIDMQQLRNVSYQVILKCSHLTCLGLKNCLHLSSEMFREFPVLKNLKKVKITRAINIKADDFEFVFGKDSMRKIEALDINGCWGVGEIGLRAITRKLSSLKSLSLKNCKSIKGPHLIYLAECPELRHLNVAHTDIQYNYLPTLHQHAKGLQSLVIDPKMYSKQTIRQLRIFFPSIQLTMSYSEFQKDERPFYN